MGTGVAAEYESSPVDTKVFVRTILNRRIVLRVSSPKVGSICRTIVDTFRSLPMTGAERSYFVVHPRGVRIPLHRLRHSKLVLGCARASKGALCVRIESPPKGIVFKWKPLYILQSAIVLPLRRAQEYLLRHEIRHVELRFEDCVLQLDPADVTGDWTFLLCRHMPLRTVRRFLEDPFVRLRACGISQSPGVVVSAPTTPSDCGFFVSYLSDIGRASQYAMRARATRPFVSSDAVLYDIGEVPDVANLRAAAVLFTNWCSVRFESPMCTSLRVWHDDCCVHTSDVSNVDCRVCQGTLDALKSLFGDPILFTMGLLVVEYA